MPTVLQGCRIDIEIRISAGDIVILELAEVNHSEMLTARATTPIPDITIPTHRGFEFNTVGGGAHAKHRTAGISGSMPSKLLGARCMRKPMQADRIINLQDTEYASAYTFSAHYLYI